MTVNENNKGRNDATNIKKKVFTFEWLRFMFCHSLEIEFSLVFYSAQSYGLKLRD